MEPVAPWGDVVLCCAADRGGKILFGGQRAWLLWPEHGKGEGEPLKAFSSDSEEAKVRWLRPK